MGNHFTVRHMHYLLLFPYLLLYIFAGFSGNDNFHSNFGKHIDLPDFTSFIKYIYLTKTSSWNTFFQSENDLFSVSRLLLIRVRAECV